MKTQHQSKASRKPRKRNIYTAEHRENARKYYLMGLNLTEIGKLLDGCPVRTLEKWQTRERWTELKHIPEIKTRAMELLRGGKTYSEIADLLKISRVTVWRYIKQAGTPESSKTR
jgi:DNA-directed RNA polymerase specialized sigma24 family protein